MCSPTTYRGSQRLGTNGIEKVREGKVIPSQEKGIENTVPKSFDPGEEGKLMIWESQILRIKDKARFKKVKKRVDRLNETL